MDLKFLHFSKLVPEQGLLQTPLFVSASSPCMATNIKLRPFTALDKRVYFTGVL